METRNSQKIFFAVLNEEIVEIIASETDSWETIQLEIRTKLEVNSLAKISVKYRRKLKDNKTMNVSIMSDSDWKRCFKMLEDEESLFVTIAEVNPEQPPLFPKNPSQPPIQQGESPVNPKYNKEALLRPSATASAPTLKALKATDIVVGKVIADGYFGVVYTGKLLNLDVAIKTFKEKVENSEIEKELKLIQQLPPHPNIIVILGHCVIPNYGSCIVMEWMNGSLLSALKENQMKIHHKLECCKQAALGLQYLHMHQIVHRDLAARNCLLLSNNLAVIRLKLTDFGLSRVMDKSYYKSTSPKPLEWTSIEGLLENKFSAESDIWSFGVLMWEIFSDGEEPYKGITDLIEYLMVEKKRLKKPSICEADIYEWMTCCWELDPKKRSELSEIIPKIELTLQKLLLPSTTETTTTAKSLKWMVCGRNDFGQLGCDHRKSPVPSWTEFVLPKSFLQISSSSLDFPNGGFTVGVALDGSVWSWGSNNFGQLGLGDSVSLKDVITKPQQISFFNENQDPVIQIHAGVLHAGVVTKSGKLFTWGRNGTGQLGIGNTYNSSSPCLVSLSASAAVAVQIQCGSHNTVALSKDGVLWSWGSNDSGRNGNGKLDSSSSVSLPASVSLLNEKNVIDVRSLPSATIVLCDDGSLCGWGKNENGELGLGHLSPVSSPTKMTLTAVRHLSVGGEHVIALCNDQSLWTWGSNLNGQLGTGNLKNCSSPVKVSSLPCSVDSVAAFGFNSFLISKEGSVYGCGSNRCGQLGLGHTSDKAQGFILIPDLSGVKYFGTGSHSTSSFAAIG